jgi:Zn-dependent protease with chaperone function
MKHFALTLCLLGTILFPTASRAALLSRSTEISMGREAAQEYERTEPVDSDPVLTARVRRIGERLIAATHSTNYPFEVHAVDTNEINAFALPGGFVYVFRGLVQLMPGDDALAFVLAHEISHVTQRHGIRQIEQSLAIGTILNFVLRPGTTSGLLQLAIDMRHSRHDEAEADRLGLELMARAGFDPAQGPEAMMVIARIGKSAHKIPPFLRSHPLPESRVATLRHQAAALRAAPHPTPKAPMIAALPKPAELPAPPTAPTASELFPLEVGLRWTYHIAGADRAATFTTAVLEEQPGQPGAFRVRTELADGLSETHLAAVTNAGVCTYRELPADARPAAGELSLTPASTAQPSAPDRAAWALEIALPAAPPAGAGAPGWETVRVPAGEFQAVRAIQRSPAGETATVWLAPKIGIVRRAWERTGLVEELCALHRPASEAERKDTARHPAPTPDAGTRPRPGEGKE